MSLTFRRNLPKRNCICCGKVFHPTMKVQVTCDQVPCRMYRMSNEYKDLRKKLKKYGILDNSNTDNQLIYSNTFTNGERIIIGRLIEINQQNN